MGSTSSTQSRRSLVFNQIVKGDSSTCEVGITVGGDRSSLLCGLGSTCKSQITKPSLALDRQLRVLPSYHDTEMEPIEIISLTSVLPPSSCS